MARRSERRCKVSAVQNIQSPADAKREATVIARYAMKGAVVHKLADGGYIVAQWGLTRHCPDFAGLVAFARQMGVLQ